jgi:MFS family permease
MNILSLKKQLLTYQLLMGSILYFLITAIQANELSSIIFVLVFHGLFAALQDICIDALAINNIPKDQIGKTNGIMQTGMLLGRSIFVGAGVYISYQFGIDMMVYFIISSIWLSLIILQFSSFPIEKIKRVSTKKYFLEFYNLLKSKVFWYLIAITYFAGYSYNGISTISSAVLSKVGSTPTEHGFTYSLLLPLSMSLGAIIGGFFSDRNSNNFILRISLILSITSSIMVGVIIDSIPTVNNIILSYIIFYFFIGSSTSTLYGFLMRNTSKQFAALEFSIFMGIVNFCDSSTSLLTGSLLKFFNYTKTSILIGAICTISLLLLKVFEKFEEKKACD